MDDLAAKGRRVAGMFGVLLGGGLLLESTALRTGLVLLLIGLGLFVWGSLPLLAGRRAHGEDRGR